MSGRRRHHHSFDSGPGEDEPLDNPNDTYDALSHRQYNHHHHRQEQQRQQASPQRRHHHSRHPPNHTGAHPDSAFSHPQPGRNRRNSGGPGRAPVGLGTGAGVGAVTVGVEEETAPVPPPHRENVDRSWGVEESETYQPPKDNVTPDVDNFSEAAAGGMPGLAYTIAERNPRESGLDAMSGYHQQQPPPQNPYPQSYERPPPQSSSPYDQYNEQGYDTGGYYRGAYDQRGYDQTPSSGHAYAGSHGVYDTSSPSLAAPGTATPARSHHSYQSYSSDPFGDPHAVYSQRLDPSLGQFNPNDIDDDGDDGLEYRRPTRNSMLSTGNSSNSGVNAAAAGAAGGAAAGGVLGGLIGKNRNNQVNYGPVGNVGPGGSSYDLGNRAEKSSDWITKQNKSKKRRKWCVIILVGFVIVGAIVGGIVGRTLMQNRKSGNSSPLGQSAVDDEAQNGDLDINSPEIRELMNNPDLHRVFPGVDYTPINVQYPECIHNPPSQNNVTRDVAVLSQLTNTIRLYGTDCNQTEMAIHALNQLQLKDEVKIWMGVWQDGNDTTNKRQLEQMWTILDTYGDSYFKGIIVANEILFRQEMTARQLGDLLDTVRSNLSDHNWNLPVATSDLGDDWTPALGELSDYIMANIHPFFAGVDARDAASWTYSFWENQNGPIWKEDTERNIISEIGWPTKGGRSCGSATVTDCPNGSVAGIDELNQLLDDWVCPALNNGTNYFWFEMFDEPWKVRFNEDGRRWEDQWGLMDVNRNLKPGVRIPDCGGRTVGNAA
ncbi:hypothetical protein DL768_004976 [Monosporascus sp. mg162]|nr:hypothetical protein DL768_004976 [Monosporascus sp. mg162]